jgi:hypothetical protein
VAIKGATNTDYPFSTGLTVGGLNAPITQTSTPSAPTIDVPEGHSVVVAAYRGTGTAGSGFTQIDTNLNVLNAQYKICSTSQSGLSIPQSGGTTGDYFLGDAIVTGAGGGVDGTASVTSSTGPTKVSTTITTTQSDTILIAFINCDIIGNGSISTIDQISFPPATQIQTGAPIGLFENNLVGNFNPSYTGGYLSNPGTFTFPSGTVTVGGHNLSVNTFNGSTFSAPLFSAVFTDQPNYNYTLTGGSPAIGAGADPGSNPHPANFVGASLAPAYELKIFGLPTPGTPIPAKTARPNTAGVFDIGAFESGI